MSLLQKFFQRRLKMIIVTINKTLTEAFFCPPLLIEYKKLKKMQKPAEPITGPASPSCCHRPLHHRPPAVVARRAAVQSSPPRRACPRPPPPRSPRSPPRHHNAAPPGQSEGARPPCLGRGRVGKRGGEREAAAV